MKECFHDQTIDFFYCWKKREVPTVTPILDLQFCRVQLSEQEMLLIPSFVNWNFWERKGKLWTHDWSPFRWITSKSLTTLKIVTVVLRTHCGWKSLKGANSLCSCSRFLSIQITDFCSFWSFSCYLGLQLCTLWILGVPWFHSPSL